MEFYDDDYEDSSFYDDQEDDNDLDEYDDTDDYNQSEDVGSKGADNQVVVESQKDIVDETLRNDNNAAETVQDLSEDSNNVVEPVKETFDIDDFAALGYTDMSEVSADIDIKADKAINDLTATFDGMPVMPDKAFFEAKREQFVKEMMVDLWRESIVASSENAEEVERRVAEVYNSIVGQELSKDSSLLDSLKRSAQSDILKERHENLEKAREDAKIADEAELNENESDEPPFPPEVQREIEEVQATGNYTIDSFFELGYNDMDEVLRDASLKADEKMAQFLATFEGKSVKPDSAFLDEKRKEFVVSALENMQQENIEAFENNSAEVEKRVAEVYSSISDDALKQDFSLIESLRRSALHDIHEERHQKLETEKSVDVSSKEPEQEAVAPDVCENTPNTVSAFVYDYESGKISEKIFASVNDSGEVVTLPDQELNLFNYVTVKAPEFGLPDKFEYDKLTKTAKFETKGFSGILNCETCKVTSLMYADAHNAKVFSDEECQKISGVAVMNMFPRGVVSVGVDKSLSSKQIYEANERDKHIFEAKSMFFGKQCRDITKAAADFDKLAEKYASVRKKIAMIEGNDNSWKGRIGSILARTVSFVAKPFVNAQHQKYTDECKRLSQELDKRLKAFEEKVSGLEVLTKDIKNASIKTQNMECSTNFVDAVRYSMRGAKLIAEWNECRKTDVRSDIGFGAGVKEQVQCLSENLKILQDDAGYMHEQEYFSQQFYFDRDRRFEDIRKYVSPTPEQEKNHDVSFDMFATANDFYIAAASAELRANGTVNDMKIVSMMTARYGEDDIRNALADCSPYCVGLSSVENADKVITKYKEAVAEKGQTRTYSDYQSKFRNGNSYSRQNRKQSSKSKGNTGKQNRDSSNRKQRNSKAKTQVQNQI